MAEGQSCPVGQSSLLTSQHRKPAIAVCRAPSRAASALRQPRLEAERLARALPMSYPHRARRAARQDLRRCDRCLPTAEAQAMEVEEAAAAAATRRVHLRAARAALRVLCAGSHAECAARVAHFFLAAARSPLCCARSQTRRPRRPRCSRSRRPRCSRRSC